LFYGEAKVYNDGSHYIAIPHTVKKPKKDLRVHVKDKAKKEAEKEKKRKESVVKEKEKVMTSENECVSYTPMSEEEFAQIIQERNRKRRNLYARRVRCMRKANLWNFNYFVTFTYDGKLHSEGSFKKKLKTCLAHLSERRAWKYIGVWERSPEKARLHFHGIFCIPERTMPGILFDCTDYSFKTHKMETTKQNTYFNENFGRSDFEAIDDKNGLYDALGYILKYIEKTGERIVYSKNLPQFVLSDIWDEDVVCKIGEEDKKLLLFDDFDCWDKGEYIGKISQDTIEKMRTSTT